MPKCSTICCVVGRGCLLWLVCSLGKTVSFCPASFYTSRPNLPVKRHVCLGRKAMTNLHSVLKIRDIALPTKVLRVKAMVFPVVMYGCESWTIKKTECWIIDALELWCWTARRSNQSILKEINPEYSLEGLMRKLQLMVAKAPTLATWCEEPTHWKRPWCWETLRVGGEGGKRGWDGWMVSLA